VRSFLRSIPVHVQAYTYLELTVAENASQNFALPRVQMTRQFLFVTNWVDIDLHAKVNNSPFMDQMYVIGDDQEQCICHQWISE